MNRGGKRPGAGRPQGALNRATESQRATLSELARDHTEEAVAALVDVMRHGASESARIAAANAVLDRGYGKAAVSMDVDNTSSDGTMTPKHGMTIEQIEERIAYLDAVADAANGKMTA